MSELIERPEWQQRAACRGVGPDVFFLERGESVAQAESYCARCVVRSECIDYSIEVGVRHGYWGATERTRRRLRRERAVVAEPARVIISSRRAG